MISRFFRWLKTKSDGFALVKYLESQPSLPTIQTSYASNALHRTALPNPAAHLDQIVDAWS